MTRGYFPLPSFEMPQNALLNLSPINNALDGIRQQKNADRDFGMQREQMDMRRTEFQTNQRRQAEQDRLARVKRGGEIAFAFMQMPDTDPAKGPGWQKYLQDYGDGDHSPEELDFRTGPKIAAAQAGMYLDTTEQQLKRVQLQGHQLDNQIKSRSLTSKDHGEIKEVNGVLVRIAPDRSSATPIYSSPQSSISGPYKDPKQKADVEEGLRKEVSKASQDYVTIRDAAAKLDVIAKQPSAASDVALIYSFMKILDPTSVVRETEYATAQNAAGVPDQIKNVWNRILSGERLSDTQRADFLRQATSIRDVQVQQYGHKVGQYRGVAERLGVDPRNVILDERIPQQAAPASSGTAQPRNAEEYQSLPPGTRFIDPEGNERIKP